MEGRGEGFVFRPRGQLPPCPLQRNLLLFFQPPPSPLPTCSASPPRGTKIIAYEIFTRHPKRLSSPLVQCPFGREKEGEAPLRPTERQPEKREKNPALAEGGRGFCLQTTRNDDILGMKVDRGRRRGRGEEEEGGRDGFPKENSFFLLSLSL